MAKATYISFSEDKILAKSFFTKVTKASVEQKKAALPKHWIHSNLPQKLSSQEI